MATLKEDFFVGRIRGFRIDQRKPLRLQKRDLMRRLGFKEDPSITLCRAADTVAVRKAFSVYEHGGFPFIIIVSEKMMKTWIPPLFIVEAPNSVRWRNRQGNVKLVTRSRALKEISKLSGHSWVEFARQIWGKDTFAGRLLYLGAEQQIIECQQGVMPSKLLTDHQLPAFTGGIRRFELDLAEYLQSVSQMRGAGYVSFIPAMMIKRLCALSKEYEAEFKVLESIAPMPTWEFAVTPSGEVITIDIDWPEQWSVDRSKR